MQYVALSFFLDRVLSNYHFLHFLCLIYTLLNLALYFRNHFNLWKIYVLLFTSSFLSQKKKHFLSNYSQDSYFDLFIFYFSFFFKINMISIFFINEELLFSWNLLLIRVEFMNFCLTLTDLFVKMILLLTVIFFCYGLWQVTTI